MVNKSEMMEISRKAEEDSVLNDSVLDSSSFTMSSSCDGIEETLDTSHEAMNFSIPVPRKLNFSSKPEELSPDCKTPRSHHSFSPPYKRVRALRLFDVPATPKTLLEKCSSVHSQVPTTPATPVPRSRFLSALDKPKGVASAYMKVEKPAVNVNPFTPSGMLLMSKKRTRSERCLISSSPTECIRPTVNELDDSDPDVEQPTKRLALHESNISRYHQEFLEMRLIGTGEFGSVYECINRLDGCTYAVKKSIKPVAGSVNEKNALNEVYAHAVLGRHQHVVRYYSAWAEDDHMVIQNEFCNGGSLADTIEERHRNNQPFTERELRQLLLHVAEGLRYIHSMNLVHMDIKPGNIFISREMRLHALNYDSADDGFEDDDPALPLKEDITYKIGDLGHVTSVSDPQVEEGDCRYLPTEILREDFSHLTKADIFALGLTVYEAAGGGPLPKNGEEWHDIRNGRLKELPHHTADFIDLIKLMVHPNPEMRPSATSLMQHPVLCPQGNKTKAQLRRELNAEKLKNELLSKCLEDAEKCFKALPPSVLQQIGKSDGNNGTVTSGIVRSGRASRLIGKKVNRSHSTTSF